MGLRSDRKDGGELSWMMASAQDANQFNYRGLSRIPFTLNSDESQILIKPDRQANAISIDEFKHHNGQAFAQVLIDLEADHVLCPALA